MEGHISGWHCNHRGINIEREAFCSLPSHEVESWAFDFGQNADGADLI